MKKQKQPKETDLEDATEKFIARLILRTRQLQKDKKLKAQTLKDLNNLFQNENKRQPNPLRAKTSLSKK
jgi:hypothetical protein